MLLVSNEATAKAPRRVPGTVTSTFSVAFAVRFGRSQAGASTRVLVPTGTEGQALRTAGPAFGSLNSRSASDSIRSS